MTRGIILVCAFLILPVAYLNAQKKTYTTQKITGTAPHIDGIFDEAVWEEVEWADNFVQVEPHAEAPASQKTRFKVLYDDNNIYVAVRCFDNAPDSIVKRMARRDGDIGDWVKIIIDSYHDLKTAFSFGVSAAGVKIDEAITNGGNWDSSWDPIWDVKTAFDEEGWTVEAKIPISQLRFGTKEEYVWGLEIGRRLYRKEEVSVWQFISPTAPEIVNLFGELYGIRNIKPKKQKDLTPYVAGGIKTYEEDTDNPFSDGHDPIFHAGLDGKIGLTNNMTLDFTINPDFGQVEADPSEVNLTTFETKFAEKRPFFIEGKNILSFSLLGGGGPLSNDNLFYSRRIGKSPSYWPDLNDGEYMDRPENTSILGAFKVTGKTSDGWSIGILESITQKETAIIDRGDENTRETVDIEPLSNYFVGRVQRDMNESNTQIGAMFTATNRSLKEPALQDFMHDQAYTGGIDFVHQWKDKTYYVILNAAASRVTGTPKAIYDTKTSAPHYYQRPDQTHMSLDTTADHLDGFSTTFQIGKAGNGKWAYTFWVSARSPGLHLNDVGYMNRTDEIQQIFWIGYRQTEPFSIFRSVNLNFNQWYATSFGLEKRYFGGNFNANASFTNYWNMGVGIDREGKGISTDALRGGPKVTYDGGINLYPYINTNERKKVQFSYSYFLHRSDNKVNKSQNHSIGMRVQLSDAWSFNINPMVGVGHDELQYVTTIDELEDPIYIASTLDQFTTQLVVRSDYSITPNLTVQLYCMPFITAGNYTDFKTIVNGAADNFEDRFDLIDAISYNADDEYYMVDSDGNGSTDYTFDQPNFNVKDFNLNLVFRWEYLPGSTLFLVWSQNRSDFAAEGNFMLWNNTHTLFSDTHPTDVFLVKLSHRFGL